MTQRFASVDLGSNTVRLLVMEQTADGNFKEVHSERRIIRLGEGIHEQKRLLDHRMQLAIDTLAEFKDICRNMGDVPLTLIATSAVREAGNREEFVQQLKNETGLELNVISWEEEAGLTLSGVLWKLPLESTTFLTFDIGGGSTEFILSKGRQVLSTAGTGLGVVRLTERFITKHPCNPNEIRALKNFLAQELQSVREQIGDTPPECIVGTAGTVTTLSALDKNIFPYDPDKIHGSILERSRIEYWFDQLQKKSLEERLSLQSLERGREDLIIAGTALVLATLSAFQTDCLTVSEYSLREGILLKAARSPRNAKN